MSKITNCEHIFFDLDHTLWDFDRNSTETLEEMYLEYDIGFHGNISSELFLEAFYETNAELWGLYNQSKVDKNQIRVERFNRMFGRLGIDPTPFPKDLGDVYLKRCPTKPHLMPYAIEILEYLKNNYQLHILTNGFADTQQIKMERSGLLPYFDVIVTSESTGHKKPDSRIFDFALAEAKTTKENSVMIGDNLNADILGAKQIGLRSVFYNYSGMDCAKEEVDYEISNLKELELLF
ncbi:MAG: putative hydrolase of the HAD superfamily [Arenicella sp.]|jgi:putative hydrolase of the HAD superfamily